MTQRSFVPVMSNGLGVESAAILLRWLEEPSTRDFPLEDLTVITAMTGKEWPDTRRDFEQHILPRFRRHAVRFVQLARAGAFEKDGIVVLDDSRNTQRLHVEGAYTLTEELMRAGTVPQFAGEHRCSLKFKAFVIETWLEESHLEHVRHSFGYNLEEPLRIAKSDAAIAARVTFGFNSEEEERVEKGRSYDRPTRIGHYPLTQWGWTREQCLEYIFKVTGIRWRKSACVYCPFARITADLIARQAEFPADVADSMLLERISLAMNPRGQLYRDQPLYQIVIDAGNQPAVDQFQLSMASQPWAVYRVRRIYHAKPIYAGGEDSRKRVIAHDHGKKGNVQRCVEKLEAFQTAVEAERRLEDIAAAKGLCSHRMHELSYVSIQECGERYPTVQEYLVAAPAQVETKARYGVNKFESDWMSAGDMYCGRDDVLPLFPQAT